MTEFTKEEIISMIAALAKRIEKLEKPNSLIIKSMDSYLLELLNQSQKMN